MYTPIWSLYLSPMIGDRLNISKSSDWLWVAVALWLSPSTKSRNLCTSNTIHSSPYSGYRYSHMRRLRMSTHHEWPLAYCRICLDQTKRRGSRSRPRRCYRRFPRQRRPTRTRCGTRPPQLFPAHLKMVGSYQTRSLWMPRRCWRATCIGPRPISSSKTTWRYQGWWTLSIRHIVYPIADVPDSG